MFDECAICTAWIFNDDVLCDYCARHFTERIKKTGLTVRHRPMFVQSLWSWDGAHDEVSRTLIEKLKGNSDIKRWQWFARSLLEQASVLPKNAHFVPIPSKRDRLQDHAFGFASALSELTGRPLVSCLAAQTRRHQRGLSKRERREIRFDKLGRMPRSKTIVLVDDVVTSGATLAAANIALGRPKSLWAWCLMDRRPIAGNL